MAAFFDGRMPSHPAGASVCICPQNPDFLQIFKSAELSPSELPPTPFLAPRSKLPCPADSIRKPGTALLAGCAIDLQADASWV
jgi:hypothetical protein